MFVPSLVICAERESHIKTIDPYLSSSTYRLDTKPTVDDETGGSSNGNLIDYMKGRSDLVNTQALLDTHTHTHQGACLIVRCFFSPILHQSSISFKECVLLDKHMLTMAMCHSKCLSD